MQDKPFAVGLGTEMLTDQTGIVGLGEGCGPGLLNGRGTHGVQRGWAQCPGGARGPGRDGRAAHPSGPHRPVGPVRIDGLVQVDGPVRIDGHRHVPAHRCRGCCRAALYILSLHARIVAYTFRNCAAWS